MRRLDRIPEPRLEPPEPKEVARCYKCGGSIWDVEVYGLTQKGPVCADCLESEWRKLTMREKYEKLGFWPVEEQ